MAKFGTWMINNTANLMRLDAGIHAKISGFYSSKPVWTNGIRVRDWLATQSWEEQMQFALDTLRRFGVGQW